MLRTSPIPFHDFSGGITDNFIDSPINKYETADNFLITENRKLATRYGLSLYNINYPQVPVGAQRVGSFIQNTDDLLVHSGKKLYYDEGSSWGTIGDVFTDITVNNYVDNTSFHETIYFSSDKYSPITKVYKDNLGDYQIRTAGMPSLSSTPTLVSTAGANNYIYAFHYYYEYNVGDVVHIDAGPVTQVQALQVDLPDVNNITINGIPELTNAADEQYDVANITVKIYRTSANEETLYLIGTIANGVTTFIDSTSEADVLGGITIYTTGGVLDNGTPPKSKYIHVAAGAMWYGNYKLGTSTYSNRVIQSVINDPDSVPTSNYKEFPQIVMGLSSYLDRVLVFCKDSIYRMDGTYDESGGGGPTEQLISDKLGCISANSIIQTSEGVFFASKTGFGFTDGFKCITVSNDFNPTYNNITSTQGQREKINGTYDPTTDRVYFSVQSSEALNGENDKVYICDMRWGISRNMSFTTYSGNNNFPTAMAFHNDEIIQGDYRGYILAYREDNLSDASIDVSVAESAWNTDTILFDYKTAAIKPFDTTRYFMPKVLFSAKNTSNLSVQVDSDTDVGNRERSMKPVRWRGNFIWGDPLFTWGNVDFSWGVQGFIEHQRHFHGDDLRGTYKQIRLTNAEVIIINSDALSTATTDNAAKTVILDDLTFSWLDDMSGYFVTFEGDDYAEKFEIVTSTASTLTVLDPTGNLPTVIGLKWEVVGKPKDEILSLLNLTLVAAPLGQTQENFTPAQLGGNT